MEYAVSKYDGDFSAWYTCLECSEIYANFSDPEEGVNSGELWEYFPFDQLTAECFGRLTTEAARDKLRARWWKWKEDTRRWRQKAEVKQ